MGYEYPNESSVDSELRCMNCNETWSQDDLDGQTCPNCGKNVGQVGPQEYWDNYA